MENTDQGCRGAAGRPRCPDKEAAILGAALALLSEQGFTRMTLDRVARAAGVSKATIHLRWKTKTELAEAALKTMNPGCETASPSAPEGARTALVAHLTDFADTLGRSAGMALTGTCLAEESHTPELLRLLREHAIHPRRAALRRILDQAGRAGEIAAADPDALVSALLGSVYADHLAGRARSDGWAERIVESVLGPAPKAGPPGSAAAAPPEAVEVVAATA